MKIYKKIVYDKNDNIIEEDSYEYHGQVAQAGDTIKKIIVIAAVVTVAVVLYGNPAFMGSLRSINLSKLGMRLLVSVGSSILGGVIGQKLAPKIDPPACAT